jgi:hypothetical protein
MQRGGTTCVSFVGYNRVILDGQATAIVGGTLPNDHETAGGAVRSSIVVSIR